MFTALVTPADYEAVLFSRYQITDSRGASIVLSGCEAYAMIAARFIHDVAGLELGATVPAVTVRRYGKQDEISVTKLE